MPPAASRQRSGGLRGLASGLAGHAVELLLEGLHLARQRVLPLVEPRESLGGVLSLTVAEAADLVGDPVLGPRDALGTVQRRLDVPLHAGLAALLEEPPGVLEPVEGGESLGQGPAVAAGAGAPHRVRCLLEPAGRLLQARGGVLAGEAFQPAAELLRLLGELALLASAPTALVRGSRAPEPLALDLLLLAAGQLPQPLHRLVDGLVQLRALAALDRLVPRSAEEL